jgi:hypothetical protein
MGTRTDVSPLKRSFDGELLSVGKTAGRIRGFFRSTSTPAKIARGCIMTMKSQHTNGAIIFEPALADGTQFAGEAMPGALYVFVGPTTAAATFALEAMRNLTQPWASDALVIDFDTSGLNNGDYIFLQDTVGAGGLNIGSTPGTQPVAVGRVLGAGDAAGKVLLCPAEAAASYAMASIFGNEVAKGTLTFGAADTAKTASLGARYANGVVVVTQKSFSGTPTATGEVIAAINGSGVLTLTLAAAPGAGNGRVYQYMALPG